jgi:hypothetical protein
MKVEIYLEADDGEKQPDKAVLAFKEDDLQWFLIYPPDPETKKRGIQMKIDGTTYICDYSLSLARDLYAAMGCEDLK